MSKLLRDDRAAPGAAAHPGGPASGLLLEVLWRRRWAVGVTVFACVGAAGVYLAVAKRVYAATARVLIAQNAPRVFGQPAGAAGESDTYLQTQADVFQSTPVLTRALEAADYRTLPTFRASAGGGAAGEDPVGLLRRALRVEVAKKSDVVLVSVESTHPREAVALADGVAGAYIAEQVRQSRAAGDEVLAALRRERDGLQQKRESALMAMLKYRRDRGILSARSDRGDLALDRAASLAGSLTTAEVSTMELRAQLEATKAALADPRALRAFVQGLQSRGRDWGDREYDDLRAQLRQYDLVLLGTDTFQGANHPRVQTLHSVVASLKQAVADKEREIAEAQLAVVTTQLAVAEAKERQLATVLAGQRGQTVELIPDAVAYERLESDAAAMQKRCEALDARILEVSADALVGPTLNVRLLESARAGDAPVRPNKMLVLAAAGMAGCVLGAGLALLRERQDARLRTADEVLAVLGTPVVATVPRMNPRLSPVARGQVVYLDPRSPSAEAYRSARTSLNLGPARSARTILLASPTSGDGKSTTASNLAIAFAQAGHRTLVLDCDLRQPVQHLIFETGGAVGLTTVVAGESKLRDAVSPTRVPGLYVLPCGPVPPHPSELLAGERFAQLMRRLAGAFDRIIIDSPPLTAVTDARILAAEADVTLLVLRMNQSMRDLGMMARDGLEKVGANVLGVVANDADPARTYHDAGRYRGTWQYATSAQRLLESIHRGPDANVGLGAIVRAADERPPASATLDIEEPDWSAGASGTTAAGAAAGRA